VLRRDLKNFQDALEDLPGGRVSGVIISSTFESMTHQLRQKKLSEILSGNLTDDEYAAVGAIATLTPAEVSLKAN